jgi:hypothetical protein
MSQPTAVVTERGAMDRDVTATTPGDMPNVRVVVMTAAARVGVRTVRTFLQAFLAAFVAGLGGPLVPGVSDVLPPGQLGEKLLAAVYIAALAALITLVQNSIELMAKADEHLPELRA